MCKKEEEALCRPLPTHVVLMRTLHTCAVCACAVHCAIAINSPFVRYTLTRVHVNVNVLETHVGTVSGVTVAIAHTVCHVHLLLGDRAQVDGGILLRGNVRRRVALCDDMARWAAAPCHRYHMLRRRPHRHRCRIVHRTDTRCRPVAAGATVTAAVVGLRAVYCRATHLAVCPVHHLYELATFEHKQQVRVALQQAWVELLRRLDRLAHPPC